MTHPAVDAPIPPLPHEIRQLLTQDLAAHVPLDIVQDGDAKRWLHHVRGKTAAIRHPRLALFCGSQPAALARLKNLQAGSDNLCALAGTINADLQVYELPTAPNQTALLHALAYGMLAAEPVPDVLAVACLDDTPLTGTPTLDTLFASHRADIAAIAGMMMAARLARVPVIGSGAVMTQLKELFQAAHPNAAAHLLTVAEILPSLPEATPADQAATALAYLKSLSNVAN